MSTVNITKTFKVSGVLTDMDETVVLSDSGATYGIKNAATEAVVVEAETEMTHASTGTYTYTLTGVDAGTYTMSMKYIYGGDTFYSTSSVVVPDATPEIEGGFTETSVCNMALGRIGASTLTDLDTDSSDEATQCNLYFDKARDALLRSHPWKFASRWANLVQDEAADSGTSTDDTNTALKLYDTDQTWTPDAYNDYYVWITGGTGANQIRQIEDTAATYLTVAVAFTTTPDETSTYEIWENYPPYPWDYQFDLPTDLLRLVETTATGAAYEISHGLLKTDESELAINYVRQMTDPTDWDMLFVQAMVLSLASQLCMPLMHDKVMKDRIAMELAEVVAQARMVNLQDTKPELPQTWSEARYGWKNDP